MIKQVIVIRKDLNMRKGKMCAQAAHASMKVILDRIDLSESWNGNKVKVDFTEDMYEWLEGTFTKIVTGCESEEELETLYRKAKIQKIPCAMIVDNGYTEFHEEHTKTAIAIGPAKSELIDKITGHLKLL